MKRIREVFHERARATKTTLKVTADLVQVLCHLPLREPRDPEYRQLIEIHPRPGFMLELVRNVEGSMYLKVIRKRGTE